jgi:hypothetical protein
MPGQGSGVAELLSGVGVHRGGGCPVLAGRNQFLERSVGYIRSDAARSVGG